MILVNHIPGNVLSELTPRNFAFSDAAEGFVFLAGLSAALAYGERFRCDPFGASAALGRRALRLYGAHVALTAAALTLFSAVTALTAIDALTFEGGRATPFLDPLRGVAGVFALSHQLAYFNILPLYVVLLGMAPAFIALAVRNRALALAVAIALYGVSRGFGLHLPSWPDPGGWYFNPFAWQLLFVIGICCGAAPLAVPYHPVAYRLSQLATVAAALVVSNLLGLAPGLVDAAGCYLDWDKTDLGLVRLFDFLTLAYCVHFSGLSARLRTTRAYEFCRVLGRNGLAVFCAASLLSAIGRILSESAFVSPTLDVLFVVASLSLLYRIARGNEREAATALERRAA